MKDIGRAKARAHDDPPDSPGSPGVRHAKSEGGESPDDVFVHACRASPLELFVRVRGQDCTAETVALYDCLARLASVALQYGALVQTIGAMLQGVKVEPAGIVTGHPTIHFCSSLPDAIGQHLLSLCPDAPPVPPKA